MLKEMLSICNFIDVRFPGNLYVTQKEYEIYSKCGMNEIASGYGKKVNYYLKNVNGDWDINESLAFQENMRQLRYMYEEVCQKIAKSVVQQKLSIDTWKNILDYENIDKPEYYLLLTNVFLEQTNIGFAINTLEFAETKCKSNEVIQLFLEKCKREMR